MSEKKPGLVLESGSAEEWSPVAPPDALDDFKIFLQVAPVYVLATTGLLCLPLLGEGLLLGWLVIWWRFAAGFMVFFVGLLAVLLVSAAVSGLAVDAIRLGLEALGRMREA
jgi:hypothetical protein